METSHLISTTNQLTGSYIRATVVFKLLKKAFFLFGKEYCFYHKYNDDCLAIASFKTKKK